MEQQTDDQKKYVLKDIMRNRKKNAERMEQKASTRLQKIKNKKKKKEDEFTPLLTIAKQKRKDLKSFQSFKKRKLKVLQSGEIDIKELGKLCIIVRLRNNKEVSESQKKILKKLKLTSPMCAVFAKLSQDKLIKMKMIENCIAYGFPSRKLVSELIYKRCHGKINGKRVEINTNKLVEDNLGKYNIICLEDLINEIVNLGENFRKVIRFIWPFKLSQPTKDFDIEKVRQPYSAGGQWGNRYEKINDMVLSMI